MRKLVYTLALLLALPATASADYRNGNSWVATTPNAQHALVKYQRLRSPETGNAFRHVTYAKCVGDRSGDYPINRGRGMYHHMHCGVVVAGGYVFSLDFWATGEENWQYRASDIHFVS